MRGALVVAMSEASATLRSFVGLNCAVLRMTERGGGELQEARKKARNRTVFAMEMGEGLLVVERARPREPIRDLRHAVPLLSTSARNGRCCQ